MVARVLMQLGNPAQLKVSLPGFDVRTAPRNGLAFDGTFRRHTVYRRGFGLQMTGGFSSVNFGEVIGAPPAVYWTWGNQALVREGQLSGRVIWERRSGHVGFTETFYAESYVDRVDFHSLDGGLYYINYIFFRVA